MALYGVSFVLTYTAWDTFANAGKTADDVNHTLRWVKDGVSGAPTNAPSEVDATNAPGAYKLTLTAAEAQAVFGALHGKSSTAGVTIMPVSVAFEQFPANFSALAITGGGLLSDTAGVTTLLARLSAARALLLDNLSLLDATISSRSTYAGGDTAGTTTLLARLSAARALLLDNLTLLDVAVSSRAAGATLPAIIEAAVQPPPTRRRVVADPPART